MHPITIIVVTAVLAMFASYLVNQLPAFKNFPGRNTFIFRVLAEVLALSIIFATYSTLTGQNDPKNAEYLAWLEKGVLVTGAILVFDSLQMAWAVWKHQRSSGMEVGIDDQERRQLLKLVSDNIQQRQRENFKNLEPQVVIPLGLQDAPEEIGQSRFIPTEDSNKPEAKQPKLLLELKRFLRLGDRPTTEIPATQRLIDVFDRADRRLLILGKPGAGKTTLLLELAAQLLEDAQQPDCDEIPVRLECSEWKDDNQPLADWLILQLLDKYKVPVGLSRRWIENRQLVPLLDGLDELGLDRQQKATTAIANFIRDYNYPALVVCCRQEEWRQAQETQETQFGLNGAVYLEPLTDEQIQSYLHQIKRPGLWAKIQSSDLKELLPDLDACKKDGDVAGLRSPLLLNMLLVVYKDGQEGQARAISSNSELFKAYIQAQLSRSDTSKYTKEQTRRYLTWLARQLKAEKTTEFEIENLQPSWLEHDWQRWIYRLIVGLIVGIITGLIGGLVFGLISSLIVGLIISLIFGLVFGLIGLLENISQANSFDFSPRGIRRGLIGALTFGLVFGLIAGLIAGLIFGQIFGLIAGLIIGLIAGLILGLVNNEIRNKIRPNEGMWNTAKNYILISISSFPVGVTIFVLHRLVVGQSVEWERSILYGLAGGLSFGLYPLLLLIQHGVLRLFLYANGSIPWNYAAFLDHANHLRLVQSIGGRYRFVHDLIREEMIGGMPPVPDRLVSSISDWIKYPVFFVGILVAASAGKGTEMVSPKFGQIAMPILHPGDVVYFDQYSYRFTDPQRYDLVSFQAADSKDLNREWIVGLPGETISVQDNQLLINGNSIDRPYAHFLPSFSINKPFKVPTQSYFVMGKRIDKNGKIVPSAEVVQRKQLTGRWLWRLWPLQRFGAVR